MRRLLLISFASGFLALGFELLWFRAFSVVSWGTPEALGLMLAFYLAGVGAGSFRVSRRGHRVGNASQGADARAEARLLSGSFACALVIPGLVLLARFGAWAAALGAVALGAGVLGSVLPMIADEARDHGRDVGRRVSWVYAANIVGAVCGSLAVGYGLLEMLPLVYANVALALVGGCVGVIAARSVAQGERQHVASYLVRFGVVASLAILQRGSFYERLVFQRNYTPEARFELVVEDRYGVLCVTSDGVVYGGGAYDGAYNTDPISDRNGIIRAYSLAGFHPKPSSVLVVGLGSGSWAQVVANLPSTQSLTVAEINPSYRRVVEHGASVASVLTNPKVRWVFDDVRRWLSAHPDARFDAIVVNGTWHWRANATHILSLEFVSLLRQRLAPGGLVMTNTTFSDDALKTVADAFPHVARVGNLAIGSNVPIALDTDAMRRNLKTMRIDGRPVWTGELERALSDWESGQDAHWEMLRVDEETRVRAAIRSAHAITDDNMMSEWSFPPRFVLPPEP